MASEDDGIEFVVNLDTRVSTDAAGVAKCLGIQADTRIELEAIVGELEKKLSTKTLLTVHERMPSVKEMPTE